MQTLYPSAHDVMIGLVSSNTCWVQEKIGDRKGGRKREGGGEKGREEKSKYEITVVSKYFTISCVVFGS